MAAQRTIKPPTSLARIAANRANALKSSGPKTAAGKAQSRANAVKHGLTGAGIALPNEDREEVEARFLLVQEELSPATFLGNALAHRMALMTVRLQRAERFEAAHLRRQARHAQTSFDAARAEEVVRLFAAIEARPATSRRHLLAMPEGVDRLKAGLLELLADLTAPSPAWTMPHHRRLDALFGYLPDDLPINRPTRYSKGVLGDFENFQESEYADECSEHQVNRVAWAYHHLIELIQQEVDRLDVHRGTLDHAAIERDRDDAVDLTLHDSGPDPDLDPALVRRYEATADRDFHHALRAFHMIEPEMIPEIQPEPECNQAPVTNTTPIPRSPASLEASSAGQPSSIPDAIEPKSLQDREIEHALGSFGATVSATSTHAAPTRLGVADVPHPPLFIPEIRG